MILIHPENNKCANIKISSIGTVKHHWPEKGSLVTLGIWTMDGRFFVVLIDDPTAIPKIAEEVFDGTRTVLKLPWRAANAPDINDIND